MRCAAEHSLSPFRLYLEHELEEAPPVSGGMRRRKKKKKKKREPAQENVPLPDGDGTTIPFCVCLRAFSMALSVEDALGFHEVDCAAEASWALSTERPEEW